MSALLPLYTGGDKARCATCEGWRFVVQFTDGWEETLPCPQCNSDGEARPGQQ